MSVNFNIENNTYQVVLYGYFQHANDVFMGMQGEDAQMFKPSDIAEQSQIFNSIRWKLCGKSHITPTIIGDLSKHLGGKSKFPLKVSLNYQEQFLFEKIIALDFEELQQYHLIYNLKFINKMMEVFVAIDGITNNLTNVIADLKSNNKTDLEQKIESTFGTELLSNIRNPAEINLYMKWFREKYKLQKNEK